VQILCLNEIYSLGLSKTGLVFDHKFLVWFIQSVEIVTISDFFSYSCLLDIYWKISIAAAATFEMFSQVKFNFFLHQNII
jgi:hypothetical protein